MEQKKFDPSVIRNTIIQYGIIFVEKFENDNAAYMEMLVKFNTIRQMIVWVYLSLVADKKILPIEFADPELKKQIWESAKSIAAGRLNNEQCISFSKALYTLKFL